MIAPRLPNQRIEVPPLADCPRCGERFSTGDQHHCRFNKPNPPPQPTWPAARAVDDGAAHRAALANTRELVTRLLVELDALGRQSPDGEWAGRYDHRFGRVTVTHRARAIERALEALFADRWRDG